MLNKSQQTKKNELLRKTYNSRSSFDLAEGYLRYEALRKLNIDQFRNLFLACLSGTKTFDELVDELVLENSK